MPAPDIVRQLVQRFEEHQDAYHSPTYNEAQLRQEFLNPFFEALGWDVANKKDYAVQYREVIHEDSIHIKGSPNAKAPTTPSVWAVCASSLSKPKSPPKTSTTPRNSPTS